MEYFKLLELDREPFSNSPDPGFFYESAQHKECLQKLEIAIRLRRGLNVVTGEVGAGKTTLCRQLIQAFSGDPAISAALLLDPDFQGAKAFLGAVVETVTGKAPDPHADIPALKEILKQHLFQRGVEENQITLLIVDEGQKISPDALEILRELLNFETNDHKLFQVVIFAQNEFSETLNRRPNLADRVNLYYRLGALGFRETRALIRHRIRRAGGNDRGDRRFSLPALWRLHRLSGGFPRKIIHLCHHCLLAMIIQDGSVVNRRMVNACARRTLVPHRPSRLLPAAAVAVVLAAFGLGAWFSAGEIRELPSPAQGTGENPAAALFSEVISLSEKKGASSAPALSEANTASPTPFALQKALPTEGEELLGTVPVAVGDTLGGLVQTVYGGYTYRYHEAVLAANPRLKNPDRLATGQPLAFPALFADGEGASGATWWISLSREPNLAAAVAKLREETPKNLPLRILATQAPGEKVSIRIVLKTCFGDEAAALGAKEKLAPYMNDGMDVIHFSRNEANIYGSWGTDDIASAREIDVLQKKLIAVIEDTEKNRNKDIHP